MTRPKLLSSLITGAVLFAGVIATLDLSAGDRDADLNGRRPTRRKVKSNSSDKKNPDSMTRAEYAHAQYEDGIKAQNGTLTQEKTNGITQRKFNREWNKLKNQVRRGEVTRTEGQKILDRLRARVCVVKTQNYKPLTVKEHQSRLLEIKKLKEAKKITEKEAKAQSLELRTIVAYDKTYAKADPKMQKFCEVEKWIYEMLDVGHETKESAQKRIAATRKYFWPKGAPKYALD